MIVLWSILGLLLAPAADNCALCAEHCHRRSFSQPNVNYGKWRWVVAGGGWVCGCVVGGGGWLVLVVGGEFRMVRSV